MGKISIFRGRGVLGRTIGHFVVVGWYLRSMSKQRQRGRRQCPTGQTGRPSIAYWNSEMTKKDQQAWSSTIVYGIFQKCHVYVVFISSLTISHYLSSFPIAINPYVSKHSLNKIELELCIVIRSAYSQNDTHVYKPPVHTSILPFATDSLRVWKRHLFWPHRAGAG